MSNEPEVRKAVEGQLGRLAETLEEKDLEGYAKLFATTANIMVINPEEDTMLIGIPQVRQFAEKLFKETDSISLKFGWITIKNEDKIAWVSTHVYLKIKKTGFLPVDLSAWLSGILTEEKGNWVWLLYHLSLPKTIEAPEEPPEVKVAAEAAAKEAEAGKGAEAEAKAEEPKEPTEEDVFYEMP